MAESPPVEGPGAWPWSRAGVAASVVGYLLFAAFQASERVELLPGGVEPYLGNGVAAAAAFEVALSLAGRGRSPVGARAGLALRLALVGAALAVDPPFWPLRAAAVVVAAGVCEVARRAGGPSVVVPVVLYISIRDLARGTLPLFYAAPFLLSVGATVAAVAKLRLGRARLERLGISLWAPAELGLAPAFVAGTALHPRVGGPLLSAIVERFEIDTFERPVNNAVHVALLLLLTGALIIGLTLLERRLRQAEAHAARDGRSDP